jgi:hypothetical protein
MSGRNALSFGDPGFGPWCPECGRRKHPHSRRCQDCYDASRAATADYTTGRHESIITFCNTETGEVCTRQCFGESEAEQVAEGFRHLPLPGPWEVQCRSTPGSIFRDLQGRREPGRVLRKRRLRWPS